MLSLDIACLRVAHCHTLLLVLNFLRLLSGSRLLADDSSVDLHALAIGEQTVLVGVVSAAAHAGLQHLVVLVSARKTLKLTWLQSRILNLLSGVPYLML